MVTQGRKAINVEAKKVINGYHSLYSKSPQVHEL